MSFGKNLKKIRESRDITQEQLAYAVGLKTKAAVSKIEKGITDPNQSTIMKLAKALGVSPLDFFDWEKENEGQEYGEYEPYKEYLPYLAQANQRTIEAIRVLLGMPESEKNSDYAYISEEESSVAENSKKYGG